jgi:hypothetical protein
LNPKDFKFFTIVRNPFDLALSAYRYHLKLCENGLNKQKFPINTFIKMKMDAYSQVTRLCNEACTKPFDFILKTETLNKDFDEMCKQLNLTHLIGKLPHTNKTQKQNFELSPHSINLIQMNFRNVFSRFNYSKIYKK